MSIRVQLVSFSSWLCVRPDFWGRVMRTRRVPCAAAAADLERLRVRLRGGALRQRAGAQPVARYVVGSSLHHRRLVRRAAGIGAAVSARLFALFLCAALARTQLQLSRRRRALRSLWARHVAAAAARATPAAAGARCSPKTCAHSLTTQRSLAACPARAPLHAFAAQHVPRGAIRTGCRQRAAVRENRRQRRRSGARGARRGGLI
jgi:hypothetical protein